MEFMVELADLKDPAQAQAIAELLGANQIRMDDQSDTTLVLRCNGALAATGSIVGNTLRSIAVGDPYKGGNCLNVLMGQLMAIQYKKGIHPVFVYTKPEAEESFQRMGFYTVIQCPEAVLLENSPIAFARYLLELKEKRTSNEPVAGIVMNGNPFTRGHQYLIETACRESAHVHLFVVASEASTFPFDIRYRLIEAGTKHLSNLTLHSGGNYIISGATFPSYFLRRADEAGRIQAELDLRMFGSRIARSLGITRRYVGEEPYCATTRLYNETMKRVLPEYGLDVREIPRLQDAGGAISASRVRQDIRQSDTAGLKNLVPETTYTFLKSEEFKDLENQLRSRSGEH